MNEVKQKQRKKRRIGVIAVLGLLFVLAGSGGCGKNPAQPLGLGESAGEASEELQVHFIDVGQGDATLLCCGEEAMLIDAGDNDQGTKIQNYLQKQEIETLKYVICTHPDADHIGGMDVILYKFDCDTVFMTNEKRDTNTFRDVMDTMKYKGYTVTVPEAGQQYSLGDAVFTVVAPAARKESGGSDPEYREGNNNSIAILLVHGENRFLFTGDAEEEEEREMTEGAFSLKADVYKAGHHGSSTSSSPEFLEKVNPSYAVISCGEGNSYGHPHEETLESFREMGVMLFRTDQQGSIVAVSDGKEIKWNCSPMQNGMSEDSEGEPKPISDTPEEDADYICNTNTMKFHAPQCPSADDIDESNRLPVSADREELISQGYVPCKRCNP